MAEDQRVICCSEDVEDGGAGFRFTIDRGTGSEPAFVIRFQGEVHAFMNRCGHVPVELDWQHGDFFDDSKLYLICATHGALYAPESGRCLGGRCNGKGLEPVAVEERDGCVYLISTE
ncbi:MAG: Rieske 2Fe-2S domain-containing protein [Zoogloeaceae bacterium]|nr:Rieske 2Fe-2S domain-containing protein [Zoogloeaceae bacterium]